MAAAVTAPGAGGRVGVPLARYTTIGLGGPARKMLEANDAQALIDAVAAADQAHEPLLVIAGGSNLLIGDAGFDGTVLRVASRGAKLEFAGDRACVEVAAGEPWDQAVECAVANGLAGFEALSGIPGSAGATPVQNVGAYGQQVSDTIVTLDVYDRVRRQRLELGAPECAFAYRSSSLRHSDRYVVLGVRAQLERSDLGAPIRYPELAHALDVAMGARAPLHEVRQAVLGLRRAKGMVLDPDDPDCVSAGSFFLNPILDPKRLQAVTRRVAERLGAEVFLPAWPVEHGHTKVSAAWLVENAGFQRGYGSGRVGISSKHTLALVNRGGATTSELVALGREVRRGVERAFGVVLEPEPTLVGVKL